MKLVRLEDGRQFFTTGDGRWEVTGTNTGDVAVKRIISEPEAVKEIEAASRAGQKVEVTSLNLV